MTTSNETTCCHFWAPTLEHEKDDELGSLSLVTPKKNMMMISSCVAHRCFQAPSPDHENNNEQLLVVIFGCLLQIMKMMMINCSSSSLGTYSTSWRWQQAVVCCHLWRLLQIMKMTINSCSSLSLGASSPSWRWWWATIHRHLWVLALHHEDDDEQILIVIFGCLLRIMKMTTNNYFTLAKTIWRQWAAKLNCHLLVVALEQGSWWT